MAVIKKQFIELPFHNVTAFEILTHYKSKRQLQKKTTTTINLLTWREASNLHFPLFILVRQNFIAHSEADREREGMGEW